MLKRQTTAAAVITLLLALSAGTAFAAAREATLRVSGMTCEGCAVTIEKALKETDGVLEARVSYEKGEAWVRYDTKKVSLRRLRKVIEAAGFQVAAAPRGGAAGGGPGTFAAR